MFYQWLTRSREEFGCLNPDGITITPVNAFADGTTNQDGSPVDTRVQLHGTVDAGSLYITDTATLGPWTLTASGRYNHTTDDTLDRLPPSAVRGSLTATNVFQRFNPAVGRVYRLGSGYELFADYSEASRAPTSI
jgi:outer membrane receptor protein involved in Fe transport